MKPIPVHILTGFLGSGKTTLLNRLIKHDLFTDAAVIINEFGEIGLDHHLVESADDTIIELANGCLCCTVRGQLVETLEDLVERKPARIIIETTGLADPGPVMQAIIGSPALKDAVRFAGLFTVFDALHGKEMLASQREATLQVRLADQIILSKLDCLKEADRTKLEQELRSFLRSLNPDCVIHRSEGFLADLPQYFDQAFDRAEPIPADKDDHHGHHHHNHDHHDVSIHNDTVSAITLCHDKPMTLQQLSMFLDLLLSAHGDHVLRLKGLANIEGQESPLIVQAVGRTLSDFTTLPNWPDAKRETRLVVFIEGMERQFVQKLFDGFMNVPATDTPDRQALENNPLAVPGAGPSNFR